ncbi:PREDICTED: alpha-1-antitrypsin-like [Gekko japonicus]|uniref:Thyroxine-binding globulin n=1 Tax=Gekko japonicus TaxID=146911 RepID=A0ABM1K223_GEKJA|nr:PREDICTED: alpha-1-antitrypsin-like [Gekko japonicus]
MKPIILLFITGILANNAFPPNSGNQYYNNNCDNRQYPLDRNHPNQPNLGRSQSPNEIVVGTNTNFAFKFLKLAASSGDQRDNSGKKNLVFSPMCISSAFAMLALGARSETSDQILRGLNFKPAEITERNIHVGFHDLIYLLNSGSSGLHMETGCCLFVQNKLHPQPDFLYGLRNIYRGDIYMENFKNTAETIQHINSYVERKTQGKISKLIDRVDPITEILMVSFFYMKANWKKPFNPKYTEPRDFYIDPNTVIKVPMMFQMGMFESGRDDQRACTILKMPYQGHADAYFILPDKGEMDRVVSSLSNEAVQAWKRILHKSSVDVYIPKCAVYGELNLKDIMYSMGIVDAFTEKADLSGITGQPQHRVNGAIHKAVMVIDEKGTEASAASAMDLVPMSMPTVFEVNSPFLTILVERKTESIVFMGKISNPAES